MSIGFHVGKSYAKTLMRVPVAYWKVPCGTAVCTIRVSRKVSLDLSAEDISRAERNISIDAFIVDESRKVVVNNMTAVPATE
jgi:hypothetical protein